MINQNVKAVAVKCRILLGHGRSDVISCDWSTSCVVPDEDKLVLSYGSRTGIRLLRFIFGFFPARDLGPSKGLNRRPLVVLITSVSFLVQFTSDKYHW